MDFGRNLAFKIRDCTKRSCLEREILDETNLYMAGKQPDLNL